MDPDPNPERAETDRADEEKLRLYADALAEGVEAALPGWVDRCVSGRLIDGGIDVTPAIEEATRAAGDAARLVVGASVRSLLELDIDVQPTNPLSIVRGAVSYPTAVLAGAGVPRVQRDADAVRMFPDDAYDLTPASFGDIDPALADLGVQWGAAKAYIHLARRRAEGRR